MKPAILFASRLFAILVMSIVSTSAAQPGPLIPREILFGNPDKASLRISPSGQRIAFLAPRDGIMNVWVAPANQPDAAQPITADKLRGIRIFYWAYTDNHILYLQDLGGDENWQLHAVDVRSQEDRVLTPFEEIPGPDGKPLAGPDGRKLRPQVQIQELSHLFPDQVLIALNNRDAQFHDLHRLNILTGNLELLQQNNEFAGFQTDKNFRVRFAMKMTADGGMELFSPDGQNGWKSFDKIPMEDMLTTSLISFDKTGDVVYMIDSRGRDTAALMAVNLASGQKQLLYENPRADLSSLLIHPTERTVQAASSDYLRVEWTVLDPDIQPDLDYLKTVAAGDVDVVARSLDDRVWAVQYVPDNGPVRYYLYDRPARKARFMFSNRQALEPLQLSPMHPVVIKARDGLDLVSYLTLPYWTDADSNGRPQSPLPMVLFVLGGPWARDSWGLDPYHQWLANRGYAVLSVNFRGSTGFGKKFINASNREWAGTMHHDLLDAVQWAVAEKIANPKKVAIMGGSYGGYATLVGLTFTPEVFACGVDIVGPSNLQTLLETIPPYWAPMLELFAARVGDPRTEEGRAFLTSRSPLTFVEKIQKPLLIGQGANDPRVKQTESDQIVQAMEARNIPVTYVLYPDEGHGFARPENRLSFNAVTDLFLAQHLGGRSEPIGDDFQGSSISIPKGAEHVPSVKDHLER